MPKEQLAQQLRQIIAQYGVTLADEPRRTSALLRDFCAQHKAGEVRVLAAVAEEGLARDLVRDSGKTSPAILHPRLAERLHQDLGIDRDMALWAVTAWAEALKRTTHEHDVGEIAGPVSTPAYKEQDAKAESRSNRTPKEAAKHETRARGRWIGTKKAIKYFFMAYLVSFLLHYVLHYSLSIPLAVSARSAIFPALAVGFSTYLLITFLWFIKHGLVMTERDTDFMQIVGIILVVLTYFSILLFFG